MSGFLEDGISHIQDQQRKDQEEIAKKKAEGLVRVRALDPMANKMVNTWVRKDEPTLKYEAEQAQLKALQKREQEVEEKARKLEILKKEKELKDREAELAQMEKELMGNKK